MDTVNRLLTRRTLAAVLLAFSGLATLTMFLGITAFDQTPGKPGTSPARYSANGDLVFRGGITGARSHEGDNYGLDALVAAVASPHASGPARRSLVFGCALGSWDAPVTFDEHGKLVRAPARTGRLL